MSRVALLALLLAGPAWGQSNVVITIPHVTREDCLNAGATWNEPSRECVAKILTMDQSPPATFRYPVGAADTFMRIDPKITVQLDRIEQMLLALKAHEDDVLHAHDFPVCTPGFTGLCRTEEKP